MLAFMPMFMFTLVPMFIHRSCTGQQREPHGEGGVAAVTRLGDAAGVDAGDEGEGHHALLSGFESVPTHIYV